MTTFYPVCVTIAFFVALLIFDVMDRAPERVNSHIFLGFVTTFLMIYLSFKDMEAVSWGLLLIPIVILVTSYFLGYVQPATATVMSSLATSPPPASNCEAAPTISNPEAVVTARKIVADANLCNV